MALLLVLLDGRTVPLPPVTMLAWCCSHSRWPLCATKHYGSLMARFVLHTHRVIFTTQRTFNAGGGSS
jgi:hypothetical protein